MKISNPAMLLSTIAFALSLSACGPKDADIKTAADAALSATPGVSAQVTKGVVTISGQFADEAARTTGEAAVKAVKGVKSVLDSATVAPPPAPVVISADDALKTSLAAALMEFSTITADVKDGVVTLNGEIKRADLPKLMQAVSAMQPKKIENKVKVTK